MPRKPRNEATRTARKKHSRPPAGRVVGFFEGVARIEGLDAVFVHEMLLNEQEEPVGIVVGFSDNAVEALLFDESFDGRAPVFRSGKVYSVVVSEDVVGRVLDGTGRPIDALGLVHGTEVPVFRPAPQITDRAPVRAPLTTGIKVIDTVLPLGRGQRELLVGDRKLGKSTLALDVVLNQKNAQPPVVCVYVLCGQKKQKLSDLLAQLEQHSAFLYTVVVAATAGDSLASQYLAPFVGCAIGEYFRDQGKDALVVYDDLTQHAKVYRDITLLLERVPGREAYPGDIFSLHAGLLERAAQLSPERGGGSLSALPIVETQEGDITSFIPTNLISITDGQIYFERGLFQKSFLPAVNVGLSVSRVGARAQPAPLREVTAGIRLALAQHKELQRLAQLETVRSEEAKKRIHRGELLLELLKQDKHTNISWPEQAVLFYVTEAGYFDALPKDHWRKFERLFLEFLRTRYFDVLETIRQHGFTHELKKELRDIVEMFLDDFVAESV